MTKLNFYDLKKAYALIMENIEKIEVATLFIQEDEFFTSETVYTRKKGFLRCLGKNRNLTLLQATFLEEPIVSGIRGSTWGTPVLKIEEKNGYYKIYSVRLK